MNNSSNVQPILHRYEDYLKLHPLTGHPKSLYTPANYLLQLGGKRIRPVLNILGFKLFSDDLEKCLPLAHALEVFHNFTLAHDDVIDKAPLRRGKPTVHQKWQINQAILTGDVMLVRAYSLIVGLETSDEIKLKIIEGLNIMAEEVCAGQQLDLDFSTMSEVDEKAYIEMIRLKTSVLLGFCLESGALLAGSDSKTARSLYNYGIYSGIAFQIMDDWLDAFGDSKFGKQPGGDILENKKTILMIDLLRKANAQDLKEINNWMIQSSPNSQHKVNYFIQMFKHYKVDTFAHDLMDEYFEKAEAAIKDVQFPGDISLVKDLMHSLKQRVI